MASAASDENLTAWPICLSEAYVEETDECHSDGYWPRCTNCEASAPPAVWRELVMARSYFEDRTSMSDAGAD